MRIGRKRNDDKKFRSENFMHENITMHENENSAQGSPRMILSS